MKKTYWFITTVVVALLGFCNVGNTLAQGRPFVIKWHASQPQELKIPIYGKYKLSIIFPSGYVLKRDIDSDNSGVFDQLMGVTGDYTIMAGPERVERICMRDVGFDAQHFTEVVDFGTVKWKSMDGAFYDCKNIKFKEGIQPPDLSQVTNMHEMFYGCTSFNQSFINDWDVSKVTNMNSMFNGCRSFNQELRWNVSNVTDMGAMFQSCNNFNKPLKWNVSKVTNMERMFHHCLKFNQSLND